MILIDPGTVTLIQNTFLQHLNDAFNLASRYALNLLYLFASIEVAIVGLFWALQQDVLWGRLFFKIIKIGLIFFIIQNYAWLLNTVIQSFAQLGGIVANTDSLTQVIFNPAAIWLYGYDVGVGLLRLAANGSSVGLSFTLDLLGFGILLVFGLLGIQIVLQLVGFYLVSFAALIFMPFGAFHPSADLFDRSVQSVLKAGVRIMVLIMVIGVALTVWHSFGLDNVQAINNVPANYNINQPLGLFFSALLFLYLAVRLPKMVSETAGHIVSRADLGGSASTVQTVFAPSSPSAGPASAPSLQAAVSVAPMMGTFGGRMMDEFTTSGGGSSVISGASSISTAPMAHGFGAGSVSLASSDEKSLINVGALERSISEATMKKMKKTFLEVLEEKEKQELLGR